MAVTTLSPGVYINEIQTLPASIAPVATAVPAFIGYVEKAQQNGFGIQLMTPIRITSMLEYEEYFGGAASQVFSVDLVADKSTSPQTRTITVTKSSTESIYRMYYNVQMYFANGGGPCWIIPAGIYAGQTAVDKADLIAGIDAVAKVDEPTLLLYPDALSVTPSTEISDVNDAALAQCENLKDRFVIMDVLQSTGVVNTDVTDFRTNGVGVNNLKYGASYYPYLKTTLNFGYNPDLVHVTTYNEIPGPPNSDIPDVIAFMNYVNQAYARTIDALNMLLIATQSLNNDDATTTQTVVNSIDTNVDNAALQVMGSQTQFDAPYDQINLNTVGLADTAVTDATAFATGTPTAPEAATLLASLNNVKASLETALSLITTALNDPMTEFIAGNLTYFQTNNPVIYNEILSQINSYSVELNPSGAMAGIYARVDRERGVWKAPANVSVSSIVGPSINITTSEQDGMNVDATSGKSVNAIRPFTGRGTLVWGARTLAGNSNEWRYVNVRRLFIFVEESIEEATEFVVFEPNTATTWQRVRGMIEAFLTSLWRDGALAGATTEEAYYVRVGLGTTMTAQDILDGKMIVEVGLAAVRPAEFIVLQFTHKLQES